MSSARLPIAMAGVAWALGGVAWCEAADAAPATSAKAADRRAAGAQALAAGDLEGAKAAYESAFAAAETFDSAGNMGLIYLALGQRCRAAQYLALALAHFPADGAPELRRALEQRLADAAADLALLEVTVAPPGATVQLDGKPVGRAPLASPLFVEAGPHRVEALAGDRRAAERLETDRGDAVRVHLDASSSDDAALPGEPADATPNPGLIAAGLGLTVAAGAVGAATAALAAARDAAAQEQGAALGQLSLPDPCGSYPETCEEIRSTQASRDTLTAVAGVSLGVAAAALTGTVLYAILSGGKDEERARDAGLVLQVSPVWTGSSTGAAVDVRW